MVVDWLLQPRQKSDVQFGILCVCVCPEIGPQISNEHTANMKGFSICFHLHCLSNSIHHTTCLPVLLSENTRTGIAQNLCAVHNSDTVLFSTLCCSVTRFGCMLFFFHHKPKRSLILLRQSALNDVCASSNVSDLVFRHSEQTKVLLKFILEKSPPPTFRLKCVRRQMEGTGLVISSYSG